MYLAVHVKDYKSEVCLTSPGYESLSVILSIVFLLHANFYGGERREKRKEKGEETYYLGLGFPLSIMYSASITLEKSQNRFRMKVNSQSIANWTVMTMTMTKTYVSGGVGGWSGMLGRIHYLELQSQLSC